MSNLRGVVLRRRSAYKGLDAKFGSGNDGRTMMDGDSGDPPITPPASLVRVANDPVIDQVDTFNYGNLRHGNPAPDGMVFVGVDKQSGKGILRSAFLTLTHPDAREKARLGRVHGHNPGVCYLPNMGELRMYQQMEDPSQFGSGFAWSAESKDDETAWGLWLREGREECLSKTSLRIAVFLRRVELEP